MGEGSRFNWRTRHGQKQIKSKGEDKVKATMEEFAAGDLHSGSKTGPKVTSKAQALAIGYAQQRRKGK